MCGAPRHRSSGVELFRGGLGSRDNGLDLGRKADIARVLALLQLWIKNGALVVVERKDKKREPKKFVEVGKWAS